MWTSEHEFESTIITILDDDGAKEDVTVEIFDEGVDIRQYNDEIGRYDLITLGHKQMLELIEAFKYPEGMFTSSVSPNQPQ